MPHNKPVNCPKCQRENTYDLDMLSSRLGDVYRVMEPKRREYPVTCKHCGHAFKLTVQVKEGWDEPREL